MSALLLVAAERAPLKRTDHAILSALCAHTRAPGRRFRLSLAGVAERARCCVRTVRARLPGLVAAGYVTRRTTHHDAYEFAVTDPATWPAPAPPRPRRGGARGAAGMAGGGRQILPPIPCIEFPGISDEIPPPLAGETVAEDRAPETPTAEAPPGTVGGVGTPPSLADCRHILALYNRHCAGTEAERLLPCHLRPVDPRRGLTDERRRAIGARVREHPQFRDFRRWGVLFRGVAANEGLNGARKRRAGDAEPWMASLDFILAKAKFDRLLTNFYAYGQQAFDADPDPADDPPPPPASPARLDATGERHGLR